MARPGGGAQVRGSHAGAARPPGRPPLPPPPRNTSGNAHSSITYKAVFREKIVQFRYLHPSLPMYIVHLLSGPGLPLLRLQGYPRRAVRGQLLHHGHWHHYWGLPLQVAD